MYELFSPRPPSLGPTMVNPHDSSTPPSSISPASKVVLYSNWQSSCSWRVRFALNLKGIPYEYKAVDLAKGEHLTPEFEKLNPLHLVPVLVDGDFVVSDSYAILMYLEEKYPENALLPVDLRLRALNLQKLIEEKVGPEERLSWAQYNIDKGFIALEKLLKNSSGKYATGDKIYMADVFLAPQIAIAARRFNMDMDNERKQSHARTCVFGFCWKVSLLDCDYMKVREETLCPSTLH
ncbi:glutathione S-transferase 2-like isoform X13 [Rhododendron vialii]|uniref:glutathione S-transferase 2-like isoform X13 n=1 Tax=Rhododendron vialii TaxID=182163 RepID=UPI002660209F|nr:glutathione S-transferase 2-like isoform X13 [Rhododendron vialii]